jgi:anti-sigma factor RsiW
MTGTMDDVADIDCIELVELVTDYLEKALPARTLRRVQRHLAGCPDCASYVRQVQAVVRAAGTPRGAPLAPEVRQRLLGLFRRRRGRAPIV